MYKKVWTHIVGALLVSAVANETVAKSSIKNEQDNRPLAEVQQFSIALEMIKQYYVQPMANKKLFENAIRGMLANLDAHSAYLDENEFQELASATTGNFGGLGLEVTMDHDSIKVITALVGTPAYKAGIKPGDYIIKIGSNIVQGMELKDAVNLMRGEPGSLVELTVIRKNSPKALTYQLKREKIDIKSVTSELLEHQYGYIRLAQFQASTDKDMQNAINALKQKAAPQALAGLILDLRNNPGGLLDSAIQVSGAFLDKMKNGKQEVIVSTKGRLPGSKFVAFANAHDVLHNAPMVVIINNGSASASEIVAGALKDNGRAVIVGTRSFGKGSVQTVLPLDEFHGIKLTTALYYTPSGQSIQAQGITPDLIIEEASVTKPTEVSPLANFTEAGLMGHLANGTPERTSKATPDTSSNEEALQQKDYQMFEALMVLKGLVINQKNSHTPAVGPAS